MDELRIASEGIGQDFDGDVARQLLVAGTIDAAHAAFTDERDDLERADAVAGSQGHVRGVYWKVCQVAGRSTGSARGCRILYPLYNDLEVSPPASEWCRPVLARRPAQFPGRIGAPHQS